jgi:4-diphosphocytidyl-2-C-methyl-D-erythritol kinase
VDPTLIVPAPAKVNLALRVGPLRPDGYHDVTTVLLTVGLADTVSITPAAEGVSLVRRPEPDFPASTDLTVRAVLALAAATGRSAAASIEVDKRIPVAAGLGGGSADCAAAIIACCSLWSIDPRDAVVERVAASLGADVPFMLRGGCALYAGRGDEFETSLAVPPLDIVLVNAGLPVPTAEVYRRFDATGAHSQADPEAMVRALATGERTGIAAALGNDLMGPATAVAPVVGEVLAFVRRQSGVLGALVAGSGGTVFGVAEGAAAARSAAAAAETRGWWAAATTSAGSRDDDTRASAYT